MGDINHVLVAVDTPHANGHVERFNKIITPMIPKLGKVEFACNNKVSSTIKDTKLTISRARSIRRDQ
ncbi:hypothetical protein GWI33_016890 [Rhynchophorus ferrugineus]|uniref:Uncharacterized protein n=1 Tax=Rhynchophorus ferrugineus TaxID=354439 RepID=A0A834M880_RHYFE|nr:hypothetical protein GWI33_016890 [Rhynchophorus ferrugineus]